MCDLISYVQIDSQLNWNKSDVYAKGQRLKVKVTEVKTQFNRFRNVTPVWIMHKVWCGLGEVMGWIYGTYILLNFLMYTLTHNWTGKIT